MMFQNGSNREHPLNSVISVNIFGRSIKYGLALNVAVIGVAYLISRNGFHIKNLKDSNDSIAFNVVDALFFSPGIETIILYFLYLACNRFNLKRPYFEGLFITSIAAIAWASHGLNIPALFPTAMFLVSAVFIVRTVRNFDGNLNNVFFGAFVIHLIYNIPYAVRQVLMA